MKLRRLLFVLGLAIALVCPAFAQQEAKPPQAQPTQEQKAAEPGKAAEQVAGPSEELAHASKEAAGEEDETAQFKASASVRWIASITGVSLKAAYWISIALNFAIVAGLIIVLLKSKLPAAFRARTASIQKAMEEARKASEESQARLREIEQRLAKLDSEIAAMRAAAEADAAAEEARIRAAAEEDKRKVVEMAEQEITAAARLARRELKSYAAELAVTLAEKRIHVDPKTDQALVRSFTDQLGESENGSRGKESS